MKNLKGIYTASLIIVMLAIVGTANAQVGGEISLGPRFGGSSGVSLKKHSMTNHGAFELLAGWNFDPNVEGLGSKTFGTIWCRSGCCGLWR
ncbi:MAG: hypothetical protein IPF54_25680 [Draconibacterium sp.]|nr:hypothetical protein [Draconibacterium sp.]